MTHLRERLRDYQTGALEAFLKFMRRGGKRGIVALPTGTGKTWLGLALAQTLGRTLWLAHREELLTQPLERLREAWPTGSFGMIRAEADEGHARDVVVASVQSLAQPGRLARAGRFGFVVCDEAHHAEPGNSYGVILNKLKLPTAGLTATVERGDGRALARVWEEVVFSMTIEEAIDRGVLVRPRLPFDVQPIHGAPSLCEAIAERIVASLADRRRVLVFTPSVALAHDTARELRLRDWPAVAVSGESSREERAQAIAGIRAGEIRAIVNDNIFTEGTDIPELDAAVLARAFASSTLYRQALGRLTRPAPGKTDWSVLDLTGCSRQHDFFSSAHLLGGSYPGERQEGDERPGRSRERVLLGRPTGPPSSVPWLKTNRSYFVNAPRGHIAVEREGGPDGPWRVVTIMSGQSASCLGPFETEDVAVGVGADAYRRLSSPARRRKAT